MNLQYDQIVRMLDATGLFGIISEIEVYHKVILVFNSGLDDRLREVVDQMEPCFRLNLLAIHEYNGHLTMLWRDGVPECCEEGETVATTYTDGSVDFWHIGYSVVLQELQKKTSYERLKGYKFSLN